MTGPMANNDDTRAVVNEGNDRAMSEVRVYENSGTMAHKEDAQAGVGKGCGAMGKDGGAV